MVTQENTNDLRILLFFARTSDSRPVVFKGDGNRFIHEFGQTETVKFNQDEKYELKLVIQPPVDIEGLVVNGQKIELEVPKKSTDVSKLIYCGKWTPHSFPITKRKKRHQLHIHLFLKNAKLLQTVIQSKFYPQMEVRHSSWGNPMTAIMLECVCSTDNLPSIRKKQII